MFLRRSQDSFGFTALGGGFSHVAWDSVAADTVPRVGWDAELLTKVLWRGVEYTYKCLGIGWKLTEDNSVSQMLYEQTHKQYDDPEPAFYYYTDHCGSREQSKLACFTEMQQCRRRQHLGSTALLIDDSGRVVQKLAYMPYGEDWVDDSRISYSDTTRIGVYQFNGKERDYESGFLYYGARYHWPELWTGWTTPDPMMDRYPGLSPYNYCNLNPVNLVDPDGREISPIYDKWGNLLGTDDQGIQGKAIVMDKENFKQGMSHKDALRHNLGKNGFQDEIAYEKFSRHYAGLKDRPDYDGFVTITEGIRWAKDHPNAMDNPTPDNNLYINAAQLDLGFLTVDNSGLRLGDDFTNVNLYDYVNSKSPRSVSTTYALGNTAIKLLDNTGTIAFKGDDYDWDYHDGSPMRNTLIFFERLRTGLNDNHGFKVSIYGTAKINQKWPF